MESIDGDDDKGDKEGEEEGVNELEVALVIGSEREGVRVTFSPRRAVFADCDGGNITDP